MRITVDSRELRRGISIVSDALSNKPALPILSAILIEAQADLITLTASDLDITLQTRVDATVSEPGSVAVHGKILSEIINEWPDGDVELSSDDLSLVIQSDDKDFTINGQEPNDFPTVPMTEDGAVIAIGSGGIDADTLADMIKKTSFAVSKDETRPVLQGVFFRSDEEGFAMVATDGHRLACYTRDLMGLVDAEAILPLQCLNIMSRICDGDGTINIGSSRLTVTVGPTTLVSRLIEGPYVDYKQIIPAPGDNQLHVEKEVLLPALRRVSILSSQYTRQVNMSLKDDGIELTAISAERGGDARESIPAEYTGKEMTMGYNAQYLQEILRMTSGIININFTNETTAAIIEENNQASGRLFYLLMPLRPTNAD